MTARMCKNGWFPVVKLVTDYHELAATRPAQFVCWYVCTKNSKINLVYCEMAHERDIQFATMTDIGTLLHHNKYYPKQPDDGAII